MTISGGASWNLWASCEEMRGTCNLFQSCRSLVPQLDIITGLRVEMQRLTEILRISNLQNWDATTRRNVK